jgi:mRNA interferase MazF
LPGEVLLEAGDDPVPRRAAVNLDSVESVSVSALVKRLGRLGDERMRRVCSALAVAVDCGGQQCLRAVASRRQGCLLR